MTCPYCKRHKIHIHIAAIIPIITHDLLSSGLATQSVEPRSSVGRATNDTTIKSVGSIPADFEIFSLPRVIFHFLNKAIKRRSVGISWVYVSVLTYTAGLILWSIICAPKISCILTIISQEQSISVVYCQKSILLTVYILWSRTPDTLNALEGLGVTRLKVKLILFSTTRISPFIRANLQLKFTRLACRILSSYQPQQFLKIRCAQVTIMSKCNWFSSLFPH